MCQQQGLDNAEDAWQQAKLTIDKLKSLLNEKDSIIAAKDDRIKSLESAVHLRELELTSRDRLCKESQMQCRKLQDEVVVHVRELCRIDRDRERRKMHSNFFKLGQIVAQRDSMGEVWHDGKRPSEIKSKMEVVKDELSKIEQMRKRVTAQRKKVRNTPGVMLPPTSSSSSSITNDKPTDDDIEVDEEDELQQLHLSYLKKEEGNLQNELENIEIQKQLFIKDVRRIRSEDSSKFNNSPVLHSRYILERLLGKGGFSEVYQAFDLIEVRTVACKIHQLNTRWNDDRKANYVRHARREYEIHKALNHPRVVKLYDMFEIDSDTFATVLEYCPGIDLDIYLKKNKTLSEKDAKRVMYQVFCCLKYLNEQPQPIIHYDLKPGNILISPSMEVKITDFGLSKQIPEEETHIDLTSQGAGTYWYLPPECFEMGGTPKISAKVDVWAAGVIFFQMLFGRKPFGNDVTQQQLVTDRIILNAHTVEFPTKPVITTETKDFVRRLLVHSQDERPDIFAVCADAYFTSRKRKINASKTDT
jgi:tousled-like kinase